MFLHLLLHHLSAKDLLELLPLWKTALEKESEGDEWSQTETFERVMNRKCLEALPKIEAQLEAAIDAERQRGRRPAAQPAEVVTAYTAFGARVKALRHRTMMLQLARDHAAENAQTDPLERLAPLLDAAERACITIEEALFRVSTKAMQETHREFPDLEPLLSAMAKISAQWSEFGDGS